MAQGLLGRIWIDMHILGRKLTSFEGSCIWSQALREGRAGGSKIYGFG